MGRGLQARRGANNIALHRVGHIVRFAPALSRSAKGETISRSLPRETQRKGRRGSDAGAFKMQEQYRNTIGNSAGYLTRNTKIHRDFKRINKICILAAI